MVLARGAADLSDRHAQCSGVERHLGNEGRASTSRGLDGAPQRLAITDQLIEIRCTTRDLSDRPVPDGSAEGGHIDLQEEVAKGRVGRWPPQLQTQRRGENAVVATGKTLKIPQALALAQDPECSHQKQIPGRDANAAAHAGIGDSLEVADQIEIACSGGALGHIEEAIPPTSTHARSPGKNASARL